MGVDRPLDAGLGLRGADRVLSLEKRSGVVVAEVFRNCFAVLLKTPPPVAALITVDLAKPVSKAICVIELPLLRRARSNLSGSNSTMPVRLFWGPLLGIFLKFFEMLRTRAAAR